MNVFSSLLWCLLLTLCALSFETSFLSWTHLTWLTQPRPPLARPTWPRALLYLCLPPPKSILWDGDTGVYVLQQWYGTGSAPRKNVIETDIYWLSYCIHSFFFLTLLRIFVPSLEILFIINHYFLVYIFKYRTSLCVNYGF